MSDVVGGRGHPAGGGKRAGGAALAWARAGGLAAAAVLALLGEPAQAAFNPAPVQTESLILVPSEQGVAVVQDVQLAHPTADAVVGVLAGARHVTLAGGGTARTGTGWVEVAGTSRQVILTYRLPAGSNRFQLTAFGAIDTLYLASPVGYAFAAAQNPRLAFVGQGTLLPHTATRFNTYRMQGIRSGQTLRWQWVKTSPTAGPTAASRTTAAGAVVAGLLAAVAGTGWLWLYLHARRVRVALERGGISR